MSRWDPFREMLTLREAMNQLLEESYVRPGASGGTGSSSASGSSGGRVQTLALDVTERDNAYQVTASLPGVRPEDIHVTVLGDSLTIRAESYGANERREGNFLLRERHSGAMQRSVTLPAPLDSENVSASYEHGVLTLTLPKSRASLPRRIQVRGSQQSGQAQLDRGARPEEQVEARSGSLEDQTPGLDTEQSQQTARDARVYFSQRSPGSADDARSGQDKPDARASRGGEQQS